MDPPACNTMDVYGLAAAVGRHLARQTFFFRHSLAPKRWQCHAAQQPHLLHLPLQQHTKLGRHRQLVHLVMGLCNLDKSASHYETSLQRIPNEKLCRNTACGMRAPTVVRCLAPAGGRWHTVQTEIGSAAVGAILPVVGRKYLRSSTHAGSTATAGIHVHFLQNVAAEARDPASPPRWAPAPFRQSGKESHHFSAALSPPAWEPAQAPPIWQATEKDRLCSVGEEGWPPNAILCADFGNSENHLAGNQQKPLPGPLLEMPPAAHRRLHHLLKADLGARLHPLVPRDTPRGRHAEIWWAHNCHPAAQMD